MTKKATMDELMVTTNVCPFWSCRLRVFLRLSRRRFLLSTSVETIGKHISSAVFFLALCLNAPFIMAGNVCLLQQNGSVLQQKMPTNRKLLQSRHYWAGK
jgi:hypothetical protein